MSATSDRSAEASPRRVSRRVRLVLGIACALAAVGWFVLSFVPVTRSLMATDAPPPSLRELGVYLLGLALCVLGALVVGGAWTFVKLQREFQKLRAGAQHTGSGRPGSEQS